MHLLIVMRQRVEGSVKMGKILVQTTMGSGSISFNIY